MTVMLPYTKCKNSYVSVQFLFIDQIYIKVHYSVVKKTKKHRYEMLECDESNTEVGQIPRWAYGEDMQYMAGKQ